MEEELEKGYRGLKFLVTTYRETLKASLSSLVAQDEQRAEMLASLINRCSRAIEVIEKRLKNEGNMTDVREEIFDLVEGTNRLLEMFEDEEDEIEAERNLERIEN